MFKIGQTVYIDEPENKNTYPPIWLEEMDQYIGKIGYVDRIKDDGRYKLIIDGKPNSYVWYVSNLKAVGDVGIDFY